MAAEVMFVGKGTQEQANTCKAQVEAGGGAEWQESPSEAGME